MSLQQACRQVIDSISYATCNPKRRYDIAAGCFDAQHVAVPYAADCEYYGRGFSWLCSSNQRHAGWAAGSADFSAEANSW
jgi:hypothetical protein